MWAIVYVTITCTEDGKYFQLLVKTLKCTTLTNSKGAFTAFGFFPSATFKMNIAPGVLFRLWLVKGSADSFVELFITVSAFVIF